MVSDCCISVNSVVPFLKTISEENRLQILYLLKSGEKCVCEIEVFLQAPQNLVSKSSKMSDYSYHENPDSRYYILSIRRRFNNKSLLLILYFNSLWLSKSLAQVAQIVNNSSQMFKSLWNNLENKQQ